MAVQNSAPVEAQYVNSKLMSRTEDTGTVGKVNLANTDSQEILDAQKFINQIADTVGTFENDPNAKLYANNNFLVDGQSHKEGLENIDSALQQVSDGLAALDQREADNNAAQQLEIDALELEVNNIGQQPYTFSGDKVFDDDVTIQGNLTVNGTVTALNSTETEIEDAYITINKNGTDLTSEGSGIEVERPLGNAALQFDSALASFFKIGLVTDLKEIIVSGVAQVVGGLKDFIGGIKTDSVVESSLDAGVTVEGVLIKDGLVDGRDVSLDGTALDQAGLDIDDLQAADIALQNDINTHIADLENPHETTAMQVGLGNVTNDAQLKRSAGDFDTFAPKAVIDSDDLLLIEDSEDTFSKKKITLAQLLTGGGGGGPSTTVMKLNGTYGSITTPANFVDGLFVFPVAANITNVYVYNLVAGTGGTTEFDVEVKPFGSGAFTSIFSTTPKITNVAGNDVWLGVGDVVTGATAPILTTPVVAVPAKAGIRFDLVTKQTGNPEDCGVIIEWSPQ